MYDNTDLKVLEAVYANPSIHKRELSRKLRLSMPSIDNALKNLKKVLKENKKGNQIQYSLDYSKDALTPMLSNVEYSRLERLPAKTKIAVKEFMQRLDEKPILALIFGSYAKGNYDESSDIDILLIYQKLENEKGIEDTAKRTSMSTNTKISPVYLEYKEFKGSFHDATKEFFKNIKKDKIIIVGMELWRQLQYEEA
jgi:predicted nucleotidyltransferase